MCKIIKNLIYKIISFIELLLHRDERYKYIIENIETEKRKDYPNTFINYRIIGCRQVLKSKASDLCQNAVFTLFRADQAQMLVTISTLELAIKYKNDELQKKFNEYLDKCLCAIRENANC